ncbi:MAG TPA: TadE/TadG family type IV pilus assembly protein [Xanthobacteraceae bacterium]|nr:TadE/TadG family type IV pilus assembly protein [Xanthobacteraceae bacterium]
MQLRSAGALSLWNDRQGSALVEGALVIPFMCVLMFGIYEFSWAFYQQHLISTGLRDAARYLARTSDPCDSASPDWPAAEENARNLATTGRITGGAARVKGWTAAMVTPQCTPVENTPAPNGPAAYRGRATIYVITVSTRFTDPSLGLLGVVGLPAPVISVAHSERAIGPG